MNLLDLNRSLYYLQCFCLLFIIINIFLSINLVAEKNHANSLQHRCQVSWYCNLEYRNVIQKYILFVAARNKSLSVERMPQADNTDIIYNK